MTSARPCIRSRSPRPSSAPCRSANTGSNGSSRLPRWPTRSMTVSAAMLERRLDATATGLGPGGERLAPAARAVRAPLGRADRRRARVAAPRPAASASSWRGSDCTRSARPRRWPVRFGATARGRCSPATPPTPSCRSTRPRPAAFGTAPVGGRPRGGLADRARRIAALRRRAGELPPRARRRGRDRCAGRAPRRGAGGADRDARPRSAPGRAARRRCSAGSAIAGPCCDTGTARPRSSSTGRWTGRCRGPRAECSRAATVHLGGTLEEIAASEAAHERGERARAAVRPVRAAHAVRRFPRAGRQAHRLGLLPRSQRLDDGRDRAPSSARSSASRRDSGERILARQRHGPGRLRAAQRQPDRGRHQRREDGPAAARSPGPWPGSTRTGLRSVASTSAQLAPRRAAGFTAWAAITPPRPPLKSLT